MSLSSLLPQSATAELVRFEIAGSLTNRSGIEPVPANAPPLGSAFIGTFIFDTDAVDTNPSPAFGTYQTDYPPSIVSLKVGSWEWSGTSQSPTFIVVGNDLIGPGGTHDSYEVGHSRLDLLTPDEPNPNLAEYWLFQWRLDGPNTIFNNTDLPEQAFALDPWTTNRWSISQWGSPPAPLFELSGRVASFTSSVVPEPSAIALAALCVFALWALRHRTQMGGRTSDGAVCVGHSCLAPGHR